MWVLKLLQKYICLKRDAFACKKSLKCSVPASENHPGWKKRTKFALCFKCNNEEQATDYSIKIIIHCASGGFHKYRKIWSPKFGQKANVKRDQKTHLIHTL